MNQLFFSFQLSKVEPLESAIKELLSVMEKAGKVSGVPQEGPETFKTRAQNILPRLPNISEKVRKDTIEKFKLYLNFSSKQSIGTDIEARNAFPFLPKQAETALLKIALNSCEGERARSFAANVLAKFGCFNAAMKGCFSLLQDPTASPEVRSTVSCSCVTLACRLFPLMPDEAEAVWLDIAQQPLVKGEFRLWAVGELVKLNRLRAV